MKLLMNIIIMKMAPSPSSFKELYLEEHLAWRMKGIILKPEGQIKFHIWLCYPGEIKIIIY